MIVTTTSKYKPGDRFMIHHGVSATSKSEPVKLDVPQPSIVIREATFDEYISHLKSIVSYQIPSHMNAYVARLQGRKFYLVSTD